MAASPSSRRRSTAVWRRFEEYEYLRTSIMCSELLTDERTHFWGFALQVAFPCVLLQSFDGDFLDLLSDQVCSILSIQICTL